MSQQPKKKIGITEVVLRDAHQSLFATRMRVEDMLPIAEKLDQVGFWSVESWGGATFDACIRYLGEDPWERIRKLKAAMPNTPQQMLLRGQNLLGYRHYADDVVEKFVERAVFNGVDVFRIFDAMNDPRNLFTAVKSVRACERHAQGTLSYTQSPVHTIEKWVDLAQRIQDLQAHSIAIKDMAGLLKPFEAFELVSRLKEKLEIPLHLHCHATTGLSLPTALKAIEAGIDTVDTAISSMSMTYGHSPTETLVSMLEGTEFDTGLDLNLLEEIAAYFRAVRKKYAAFEGSLKGVDGRILVAQVPGGMLTNMENQLKEQGVSDKLDAVLEEIPRVREDLGYIPLVTPTSQIVGTQAVMNVLTGARYERISKETAGILKGEYGAAPANFNKALQQKVLKGEKPVTVRPADLLEPEFDSLTNELKAMAKDADVKLSSVQAGGEEIDDVLIYALFPQVGFKFLKNRHDPGCFEPVPVPLDELDNQKEVRDNNVSNRGSSHGAEGVQAYSVRVNGTLYQVEVSEGDQIQDIRKQMTSSVSKVDRSKTPGAASVEEQVVAPLAGTIVKLYVHSGQGVQEGDVLAVMEAMKMETEIRATKAGTVSQVLVQAGENVVVGGALMTIA